MEREEEDKRKLTPEEIDEFAIRFGVCTKRKPMWIRTQPKLLENIVYYEQFTCKSCKNRFALLLPKDANPCPKHSEPICCSCCMYARLSTYCIGRDVSFVLPL